MEQHPMNDLLSKTMEKLREIADANTVIGNPISVPNGATIIPISKVNLGFVSGGSDHGKREANMPVKFGGGSGAGVTITPIAFMVLSDNNVRMIPVPVPVGNTADRVIDMIPDILNRVEQYLEKREESKDKNHPI